MTDVIPDKIQKILVVSLSNLGDAVLTLPVLESLSRSYPKSSFDVITGPSAACVFATDPRIRRAMIYQKKSSLADKWRLIRLLRSEHYDLVIDLRRSLIGLLCGAPKRNNYLSIRQKNAHRVRRHLESLKDIAPIIQEKTFLRRASDSRAAFRRLVGIASKEAETDLHKKWVVAAVGSKADIKKWPAEYYAECLDRLACDQNCQIVLVGDAADAADAEKVQSLMITTPINLCGKTDFRGLCLAIGEADLVLTNDSAPLHIADALQVPVLAIFGPTDERKYGPRGMRSLTARKITFCSPCERAQCRYAHECMKELLPGEVYQKAVRILKDDLHPHNMNILAVRLDRLGDSVLSYTALRAIRERFPNATLTVMARPALSEVFAANPDVDEVLGYAYEKRGRHSSVMGNLRFVREVIKRRFDVVFILNPSLRSYLIPWVSQIPYRVGFQTKPSFLLTHSVPDTRHEGKRHESEYTLQVISAFDIGGPKDKEPRWAVSVYESEKLKKRFPDLKIGSAEPIVAIHPGASCPSKRWPLERFAELGRMIMNAKPHARLVVIGGREEKELGRALKQIWGERAIDLTGQLSVGELAAFLKNSSALISNDSGPVHVACAVGIPVVSIFGRNQAGLAPTRWRPLGRQNSRVLQKDVGCVVCLAHRCTIQFECLKQLSADEVYRAYGELTGNS